MNASSAAQASEAAYSHAASGIEATAYLTFVVDADEFGIEFSYIQDVVAYKAGNGEADSAAIAGKTFYYCGGNIPVIDLRKAACDTHRAPTLVILQMGRAWKGIIVDSVTGLRRISPEDVLPVPAELSDRDYVIGIANDEERALILLDAESLVAKFMLAPLETYVAAM